MPKQPYRTFTPLFDDMVIKYGREIALVYGVMWRFSKMARGECSAAIPTLSERIASNRSTVHRHIKFLLKEGQLIDKTPGMRNQPHRYQVNDTGWNAPEVMTQESRPRPRRQRAVAEEDTKREIRYKKHPKKGAGCPPLQQPGVAEEDMNQTLLRDKEETTERNIPSPLQEETDPASRLAISQRAASIWDEILVILKLDSSQEFFARYLFPCRPVSWDEQTLIIQAGSPADLPFLQDRFALSICKTLRGLAGRSDVRVKIIDLPPH